MKIAVWADSGIGGTEKAATLYATGLAKRGHQVDYLSSRGLRTANIESSGVRLHEVHTNRSELLAYFGEHRPDVVHQHVPGYLRDNPIYGALAELPAPPPVIETNVFGRLEDPVGASFIKHRMFISMASGTQAFQRIGRQLKSEDLESSTVVYYPTVQPSPVSPARRSELRQELGIEPTNILAIRVGRVSQKWTDWECLAHQIARRSCVNLKLLLMEPPPELAVRIQKGHFGPGIIIHPITTDFAWLEKLYASADFMVHASNFGESFGYTLSEGLSAGLPVVTRTTPWGDNAQVELVENTVNGFVCASVPEIARRMVDLAHNEALRTRLSRAAKTKMETFAQLDAELDVLEAVMRKVTGGSPGACLNRRNSEWLDFSNHFRRLEWITSERPSEYPVDYIAARAFAVHRSMRTVFRRRLDRLKSVKILRLC